MTAGQRVKRAVDLVAAAVLLVLFAPLMAVISGLILLLDGGPVLFTQVRPGWRGEPFACRKFKTMRAPRTDEVIWRADEDRVTRLGRVLRGTSLDELPQLFNVLAGQMSLVGPRPLLLEYLPHYSEEHRRRHDVRPGITGLAQVSGRRTLTFSQRLDLDISYVDRWSLLLDLRILARTVVEPFRPGVVEGQTVRDVDDLGLHRVAVDEQS